MRLPDKKGFPAGCLYRAGAIHDQRQGMAAQVDRMYLNGKLMDALRPHCDAALLAGGALEQGDVGVAALHCTAAGRNWPMAYSGSSLAGVQAAVAWVWTRGQLE